MAMTNRNNTKFDSIIMHTLDELVPQGHLVRKLENALDFRFIYPKVRHLYSRHGRPSIDPVVLFKMLMINIIFGYNSMRRTCQEIQVNLAHRWFLGISIDESVPNFSTWSQNYIRRYKDSAIFEEIFEEILSQAMSYGFVDCTTVFGDSTHQKANANKRKAIKKEIEVLKKKYEDDLLKEINEDRECIGKKAYDSMNRTEYAFDQDSGEDFAYSHQTFCDKNAFVLTVKTVPGNIHDSVSFFDAYQQLMNKKYANQIQNVSLDAGYASPAICREIIENKQDPYMPYKRPMTKRGFFKKHDYAYDEEYDCYICPNNKVLSYTTTTREGYRQYKSDPEDCMNCPFRNQCTKSRNHVKVINRHLWERYRERSEEIRHTPKWKEIYPQRKETIERVFAECKENNGLRFTRLKGLKKNQHNAWLIFACHNLKKMAIWNGIA